MKKKQGFMYILLAAVLAGTIYVLNEIGFSKIFELLRTIPGELLALSFLLNASIFFLDCWSWKVTASKLVKIRFRKLFPIFLAAGPVNNFTPGARVGGEPLKAHYLSKLTGKPKSQCLATTIWAMLVYGIVFLSFSIAGIAYLLLFVRIPVELRIAGLVVLIVFVSLLLFGFVYKEYKRGSLISYLSRSALGLLYKLSIIRKRTLINRLNGVNNKLNEFRNAGEEICADKSLFAKAIFIEVVSTIILLSKTYVILWALGIDVSLPIVMLISVLSYTITYVTAAPGGLGVAELSHISLYSLFGINPVAGATAILIDRFWVYLIVFVGGGAAMTYTTFTYREY